MVNPLFIQQEMMKLSTKERLQLYELTASLAEEDDLFSQDDYLSMYLLNERNWQKDYGKLKKTKTSQRRTD